MGGLLKKNTVRHLQGQIKQAGAAPSSVRVKIVPLHFNKKK